jgi:signal transduction histidine kinase
VRANGQAVAGDFAPAGAAAGLATRTTPSSTLRFAPGTARALEIRYTATSLVAPDQVHFKYRLLGFGSDWLEDADNRRVVSYANLRPGRYTFQVTACNNHGLWNDTGAEQMLELLPYFYETTWFYALCAALIALVVWTAHRLRVRVLARLQVLEHQHALDRERARIAHDIHDDLGSRLSQIAILGELADSSLASPEGARHQLDKMRATTGEVFQALDEIVWTTNPKQDSVAGLVSYLREYAPEFLGAAGLTCRLDFPSPIPAQPLSAEARHHLFLAAKESLNNIVKHAQATEVSLRLRLESRTLTLVLQDNGCGLTVANPQSPTLGNGLANMRERITSLGGKFTLHSEPGSGTRIQFQVPV